MTTSPVKDLCRATERSKGQTHVCQLPLNHPALHDDLVGHQWASEPELPGVERIF